MTRRMSEIREAICDSYCASSIGGRDEYIDLLFDLAERISINRIPASIGLTMVQSSQLEHRIARIGKLKRHSGRLRQRATIILGVVLTTLLVASLAFGQAPNGPQLGDQDRTGTDTNGVKRESRTSDHLEQQSAVLEQKRFELRMLENQRGTTSPNVWLDITPEHLRSLVADTGSRHRSALEVALERVKSAERIAKQVREVGLITAEEHFRARAASLKAEHELKRFHASHPPNGTSKKDESSSSEDTSQSDRKRKCFVIGNSLYYQVLGDLANRRGLHVGPSFNTQYEKFLPQAKGSVLIVETHRGVPIVSIKVLEEHFPNAGSGIAPGRCTIEGTEILFVNFDQLIPSPID